MTDKVYPTTTQVSTQIHIGIGGSSSNRTLVGIIIILENVYNFPSTLSPFLYKFVLNINYTYNDVIFLVYKIP